MGSNPTGGTILKTVKMKSIDRTWISPANKDRFVIFSAAHPVDWATLKVLDYGCNVGRFLESSKSKIKPCNYLGIDILPTAVQIAKETFPEYEFIHYDKWHISYNPTGIYNLDPASVLKITDKFDVIIAYSVFTHYTMEEAIKEIDSLKKLLAPNGCILLSLWDAKDFKYRAEALNLEFAGFNSANSAIYLIDQKDIYIDFFPKNVIEIETLFSYYNIEHFLTRIENSEIVLTRKDDIGTTNFQTIVKVGK